MKTTMIMILLIASLTFGGLPILISAAEPSVSYFDLAVWYSPVIAQDAGCIVHGDYITRIDYDGDYIGNNNWNNLGRPTKARPLPAYVYYAVQETETHYFIWYALYHPADDFSAGDLSCLGHIAGHENDLEGFVMTVKKDGTTYGDLRMVQTQAHWDFYQYTPPGETGITNWDDDIDGTIYLDFTHLGVHPKVYVEGGGHGIKNEDTGDWPSVYYYYAGIAQDPDDVGWGHVHYDLLSIFSEMWEQRYNCCGSGYLYDNPGSYNSGSGIIVPAVKPSASGVWGYGFNFDGNDGQDDAAKPPWNWDDDDDGPQWLNGDWFMTVAGYHAYRFEWAEPFSTTYLFHPFAYEQLGGDIYNGKGGITKLSNGPYNVVFDVTVLPGQRVEILPAVTMKFKGGTSITAEGTLVADGSDNTIQFIHNYYPDRGITINGDLQLQNGGSIRFRY